LLFCRLSLNSVRWFVELSGEDEEGGGWGWGIEEALMSALICFETCPYDSRRRLYAEVE
jgi:hypothetical protein